MLARQRVFLTQTKSPLCSCKYLARVVAPRWCWVWCHWCQRFYFLKQPLGRTRPFILGIGFFAARYFPSQSSNQQELLHCVCIIAVRTNGSTYNNDIITVYLQGKGFLVRCGSALAIGATAQVSVPPLPHSQPSPLEEMLLNLLRGRNERCQDECSCLILILAKLRVKMSAQVLRSPCPNKSSSSTPSPGTIRLVFTSSNIFYRTSSSYVSYPSSPTLLPSLPFAPPSSSHNRQYVPNPMIDTQSTTVCSYTLPTSESLLRSKILQPPLQHGQFTLQRPQLYIRALALLLNPLDAL